MKHNERAVEAMAELLSKTFHGLPDSPPSKSFVVFIRQAVAVLDALVPPGYDMDDTISGIPIVDIAEHIACIWNGTANLGGEHGEN